MTDTFTVKFHNDPITGGVIAEIGERISLAWYPGTHGGPVTIGNHFAPGAYIGRVTNPKYEWAANAKDFRRLVREFVAEHEAGGGV